MKPGKKWRVRAEGETVFEARSPPACPMVFDELVIDDWLHLEQMSRRTWWLGLDKCRVNLEITVDRDGRVRVWHREAGKEL